MKIKINKKARKFAVGLKKNTIIKDLGKVYLNDNEQLTFIRKKSQYDLVKKNWGYYATPSINKRLKSFAFRTFITRNSFGHIYIMIVHKEKVKQFKRYLKMDKINIVKEITNGFKQNFKNNMHLLQV